MLRVAARSTTTSRSSSRRQSALTSKRKDEVEVEVPDIGPSKLEFRVDQRIEVLDQNQVWYPAHILDVKTAKDGSACQIRVHYDGWDSDNDENLKVPSERIAPIIHTYTLEFKGRAYLELDDFEGLWPCLIQFRMPTSNKLAENELVEVWPRVFVVPYLRHLLEGIDDNDCWVKPEDIHVWTDYEPGETDDEDLIKAYKAAAKDTSVLPLEIEGDDLFEKGKGALLRNEHRVKCDIVTKKQSAKRVKRELIDEIDYKTVKTPPLFRIHDIGVDPAVKATKECLKDLLGHEEYADRAFHIAHFFLYCYERDMMRVRSNRGEDWPLSKSDLLGNNSFCNNYRELDRGTAYFHDQALKLWDDSTHGGKTISRQEWVEKVLWAAALYRLLNRVDTFLKFKGIPLRQDWPTFKKHVGERRDRGEKVFTGAHQTCNWDNFCASMEELAKHKGKKLKQYAERICKASLEVDGPEKCVDILSEIHCVGDFFAWQISCDLMESKCLGGCGENDWAVLGPGARNGIEIIFGEGEDYLAKVEILRHIQDDVCKAVLNREYPKWDNRSLSLKSLEHALCEFCKYYNVEGSVGKKKNAKLSKKNGSRYKEIDDKKTCRCGQDGFGEVQVTLCDTCLNAYCCPCEIKQGNDPSNASDIAGWRCSRCKKFDRIEFEG